MSADNSFHKSAPTTGNDRLPTVLRGMNGVVRRLVEADLSLCDGRTLSRGWLGGVVVRASDL